MKRFFSLTLLLMMLSIASWAAKVQKDITIKVNGVNRSFRLYVPAKVDASVATPLVFSLHGTSGHSSDMSPFRSSVADTYGCIVVYPQGSDINFPVFGATLPGWHSTGEYSVDIDFFKAIIEEVAASYTVDRERIYCCGFSNGGMMTYTVANVASDIFAAFCSISGFQLNEFHLHHSGARPVPFLHIHGKADNFVDVKHMPKIVDNMVARIGAKPVPSKTTSSGNYERYTYKATEGGFPYIYYLIDGMGHSDYTDKTADKNSALTMWKFMSQYTLSSERDETLKWRPAIETENYSPKDHGWNINTSVYLLMYPYNKDTKELQSTSSNQNVYPSLQFEKGKFKYCMKATCDEPDKSITIKIKKLTGNKKVVLNQTVTIPSDGNITCFFDVEDDWAEYQLTVARKSSTDQITCSDIAIYTATEEEAAAIAPVRQTSDAKPIFTLSGNRVSAPQKGINIIGGKKILVQ